MFTLSPNLLNYFDIESKLISLGHLAGQLGGFVGESESVKKAVKNAIKACFDNNSDLKNDLNDVYNSLVTNLSVSDNSGGQSVDNLKIIKKDIQLTDDKLKKLQSLQNPSLPPPSPSADSDKLQSKLEALKKVQKLCGFHENSNNALNDPTNILNNLCTGLEKFLGFNSESKGYDGTGIVYSDLDRLCDGVMGFLYQVLKDVSEKQPYEAGVEGFTSVVDRVTSRVRQYNEKIVESNTKVGEPINKLLKHLKTDFPKESAKIPNEKLIRSMPSDEIASHVKPTELLAEKYVGYGNQFEREILKTTKVINDLHYKLRESVSSVRECIKHETSRLETSCTREKRSYVTITEIVDKLATMKNCINEKIQKDVKDLVEQLKAWVKMILNDLEKISKNLQDNINQLQQWINEADGAILQVGKDVNKIVNGSLSYEKNAWIDEKAKELNRWRDNIGGYVIDVTDMAKKVEIALDGLNGELKKDLVRMEDIVSTPIVILKVGSEQFSKKIAATQKAIDTAIGKVSADLDNVKKLNGIKGITDKMKMLMSLKSNAYQKLTSYFSNLDSQVMTPVKEAMAEIAKVISLLVNVQNKDINLALSSVKQNLRQQLQEVQKVVNGTVTDLDITKVKIEGIDMENFSKLELTRYAPNFQSIIPKLQSNAISKEDVRSLLTYLSGIAKAVTTHSHQVVQKVMTSIKEQIHEEVKVVVEAIHVKVERLKNAVDNDKEFDIEYYSSAKDKAKGLKKLVSDFDNTIKNAIDAFAASVGSVFKKSNDGAGADMDVDETLGTYKTYRDKSLTPAVDAITKRTIDITAGGINTALTHISTEITASLKHILKAFDQTGNEVQQQLTLLKNNKIGMTTSSKVAHGSLQELHNKFTELQSNLQSGPLRKARAFAEHADQLCISTIQPITDHVNQEFDKARYNIITDAHKSYILSVKSILEAFVTKTISELEKLPAAIEDDKHTGFKGFMEKLYDSFNANIVPKKETKSVRDLSFAFQNFCSPLHDYLKAEIGRQNNDNHAKKHPSSQRSTNNYSDAVDCVQNELEKLVNQIRAGNRYDHHVPGLLDGLTDAINGLHPESFSEPSSPLLETIAHGFRGLVGELAKAYISAYDSETIQWTETALSTGLTQDAHRCAKIFLTAFSTIYEAVHDLRINCNSLKGHQIHSTSDLGRLFLRHGFRVSHGDKQHWELQNKDVINGEYVANRISFRVDAAKDNEHLKKCESNERKTNVLFNLFDILKCLLRHVDQYNAACHIAILPKPRTPCTVFEMLVWLSGLTYTSAYQALLSDGFTNVLDNPDTPLAGDGEITVFDIEKSYLEAHPQRITYKSIRTVLQYLCSKSYDLLTTVVGHGDAATFYACDYSNNTLNLYYPSSGEDCLQMLLDFLRRILQPLRYLFERCSVADKNYGWADCHYGRDIPTTKSHCNIKPTDEAACQPNCQPNCKPNCQPTSPLMNYLCDSLLGYLPHRLDSVGCKSKCSTCPSTSRLGMPCLTPMGFRGFSGSTKTGADLCEIIREFLGSGLVSSLLGLSPTPPKTLPEHFGFGLSLVNKWVNVKPYLTNVGTKPVSQTKIEASIQKLSIKLYTDTGKLTNVLCDAYGNSQHEHEGVNHLEVYADVSSLCMTRSCEDSYMRCAPYLSTLASDAYQYLVHKNFATYLTWAVYLPWDLWTQLNNLCNAFKNIFCQDWGCHTCLRAEKCKRGQHGLVEQKESEPAKPHCKCPSMVQCKGVSATLYQFGFCFGNAATLNNETSPKSCSDFCSQLDRVLKSDYFVKLFTECDNFIWTIREPFTYLVLALWSLSLFYLICAMVGRLDVLHIKSHLRSPSSHKITAQSLLAAAQVGRLAKISYLQP
ncbi:hypothetical protein, conserved [Babesia bigemina]|uniref:C3H1-type domain-containing protein n=1 Tax=Babesia bigemina TaxID=5866 RepID=A0A061BKC6_BABBI|nr:hypothetical protein, conserved [Babesia bigemina]CDR71925.1 hypothetical protein, conserved [Babesia bigemina]|eukprot:XP_012770867.1 hypothetical protein, conserved [Babesia bigemina]